MKDILVISPWIGKIGPNTFLDGFCKYCIKENIRVTIIYPYKDSLSIKLSEIGCKVVYVKILRISHISNPYFKYIIRLFKEIILMFTFLLLIPKKKYSSCLINTEIFSFSLFGLSFFRNTSVVVHSLSFEASGLLTSIVFNIQNLFVTNYIAVSSAVSSALQLKGVKKPIYKIYNGLDTVKYKNEKQISNSEVINVLSVIHPIRHKGGHHLLDVVKYVVSRDLNLRFTVVGWSNFNTDLVYKQELENIVKLEGLSNFVQFKPVSSEMLLEYSNADIYLHPSESESFGYVLIEAMAMRLPIVAFNVGGIPEIVDNGTSGYLIEPFNTSQMGEAILSLKNNFELRKKFGDTGLQIVKDRFELEDNLRLMLTKLNL